jgi:hypothetical protein
MQATVHAWAICMCIKCGNQSLVDLKMVFYNCTSDSFVSSSVPTHWLLNIVSNYWMLHTWLTHSFSADWQAIRTVVCSVLMAEICWWSWSLAMHTCIWCKWLSFIQRSCVVSTQEIECLRSNTVVMSFVSDHVGKSRKGNICTRKRRSYVCNSRLESRLLIYLFHPLKSSKVKERLYGSPLVWSHPEESILFAYRPHI